MPTPPNPQLLQNIPPVTQARDLQGANSVNSSSGSNNSLPKNPAIGPPVVYATDHIDMLDPSDPWGMRWHHDGRYEVGVTPTPRGNPTATWAGTSSPAVDVSILGAKISVHAETNLGPLTPTHQGKYTRGS